jgi:serine/threonine protein kinase
MREVKILQRLSHPNIITLYEAFDSPKQVFLVTEYVDGRNLSDYVKQFPQGVVPEAKLKSIGKQLLEALASIHSKSIFH